MEAIKVSVVVPVYNVDEFLDNTLSDITGQTLREIEIICVDDGSTDNLISYLNEQTIVPHDRLKCYSFESNNGPF